MKRIKNGIFALLAGIAAFMLLPMQAFAVEPTMGEKMKAASYNTVVGIVTVFLMLVVISLVIYCLRFLPRLVNRSKQQETREPEPGTERVRMEASEPSSAKTAAQPDVSEKAAQPDVSIQTASAPQTDKTELVAVIAAAIAAQEQVPVGSFVVRTIKRRT
ncbi:MAG: OadG family protein [Lachnospiraceae bacterium]|nr:OadG family protein [Lachnospiraceae bacterium]